MAATRKLAALATTAIVATSVVVASGAEVGATPVPAVEPPLPGVAFQVLGRYDTGDADPDEDVTAAEIVAFEDDTLYVMSASSIDVVDISDPQHPVEKYELALPGDPTSVAVNGGLLAVSVPAEPRTGPGRVLFFRGRTQVGSVTVGSLPDMVTFTPDGSLLAVANEGEPSNYGQPDSVDPEGSISVVTVRPFRTPGILRGRGAPEPVTTIGFTDFNVGGPRHGEVAGVRITGPNASVAQDLEPEYITVADDSRTAWVSLQENNAIAQVDLRSKRVVSIAPLGLADHSIAGFGIDPSNEDGAIAIARWGVKGMYMPDGIASYAVGGERYVITANEGDAREYDGHSDVGRARSVADASIPGASVRAQLGQLNVSTASDVPKNAAGRVTELRSFGSRSITIRTADGQIVWDSGDDFEQIVARTLPGNFNASNSNNTFDNRSDDKGPEPESVVVGEVDGRQLAFVGLERIGGVMVYDVTDPTAPVFQQYLVTRVFDGDVVGPDSGPEGMAFIAAADSPTGQPLLAVGNEVTGTVNIFGAVPADPAGTLTLLHNNDGESTVEPLTVAGGVKTAGVAAYKSVLDREIRDARNRGNAVMNVYAGDAFLASSTLACSLPPLTAPVYDAVAQRQMTYDAHIFGNHEFDFNPDFLERFVRTFSQDGTPVQPFLSSNLDFSGEPTWASLLDGDGAVQVAAAGGKVVARSADLVDEATGMRVGVVGATTPSLPAISSPRNVLLTSSDIASTAAVVQAEIDALTARGVNKIIVVSHLQSITNDVELVSFLSGADVAVAGGGDELLANADTPLLPSAPAIAGPYPRLVSDATGGQVPLVTTEGNYKYVGRLDLQFDVAGKLVSIDGEASYPRRVVVQDAASAAFPDAVPANPAVQASAVAPVSACLSTLSQPIAATQVPINVGQTAIPALGFTRGVRTGETNGGNLVTDGYLRSYDVYSGAAGLPPRGGAVQVVAVQNGGGIRQNAGNVLPVGTTYDATTSTYSFPPPIGQSISRRNTLDVLAFLTNAMTVVTDVTPIELKSILEWSGSSLPSANGKFLQIAGMTVAYDTSKAPQTVVGLVPGQTFSSILTPGDRVRSVTLADGTKVVENGAIVAGAPNVSVVTNSFTAAGGDNYVTLGEIPQARKVNLGATYEQTLVEYLLSFPPVGGLPTLPSTDPRYSNPNGEGRITIAP